MSITLTPFASILETREGLHHKAQYLAVKDTIQSAGDCFFCLFNCEKPVLQFINLSKPGDARTNDENLSFIFRLVKDATMTATLEKESDGTSFALIDNTYGILKDLGSFIDDPRVWGFFVDWKKIQALLGFGKYRLRFIIKAASSTVLVDELTTCFHCLPFSCEAADGTVRIETQQGGYISNGFDYSNVNANFTDGFFASNVPFWPQQVRWYGALIPSEPDYRVDNIILSDFKKQQVQAQVIDNFSLRLDFIRKGLGNQLIKDNFLANKVLISDYNRNPYEEYTQKDVKLVSIDDYKPFRYQRGMFMNLTFQETDEGTLKRNNG